ncbi:MAG: extracellular solute-binding protein [Patescibacteria group bacterium]
MNIVQVIVIGLCIIAVILAILFWSGIIGPQRGTVDPGGGQAFSGEVRVWGTLPSDSYIDFFTEYEASKNIRVSYSQHAPEKFTEEIVRAIARREGPDVVLIDIDWITSNYDILTPTPPEVMQPQEFRNTFIDASEVDLVREDKIWGFPIGIDPLVLYWNKDIFNANSIPLPPKNWNEVLTQSNTIKRIKDGGVVGQAGIALGRSRNIPLYKEIVSLLLLQLGGSIENQAGELILNSPSNQDVGGRVFRFFTDFGKSGTEAYSWTTALPPPRVLFSQGKLGMMLDYLSYESQLREQNPHISFDIAPLPQPQGNEVPIYYATTNAVAVLVGSPNIAPAWQFAKSISGAGGVQRLLVQHVINVPARRDQLNTLAFTENPRHELLRTIALNTRRPINTHTQRNSNLIADIIEAIANGQLSSEIAISQALEKTK